MRLRRRLRVCCRLSGGLSSASLSWGAATDNVGVVRYNVHRGTSAGFTPSLANRVAQPRGRAYSDTVLAAGVYYYRVAAEDAAGNVGPFSNEASATVGDTSRAVGAGDALGGRGGREGDPLLGGGDRQRRCAAATTSIAAPLPASPPRAGNRIAQPSTPGYIDTTAPGSYFYKVTAEDAAGNIGAVSNEAARDRVGRHDRAERSRSGLPHRSTGSTVNLSWTGSSDDVAVLRYNVHRGTQRRLHAQRREPDRATDRHQLRRHRPHDRHLLLQGHRRRRRRQHQRRLQRGHRHRRRRHPAQHPRHPHRHRRRQHRQPRWGAATDNVGVSRYNLHRGTSSGFTPSTANRIAQPTGLSYADTNLSPRQPTSTSSPPKTPPATSAPSATPPPPPSPTPPHPAPHNPHRQRRRRPNQPHLDRRHRQRRRHPLQPPPLHQQRLHPHHRQPLAQPTTTSYTDTGLSAGTYYYKLTAEDAAGNLSPPQTKPPAPSRTPPVTGLVAAYGFDTGTGTTITDQSGTGNNGTLTNATWTDAPANTDNALTFNGTNASVTIPDTNSLDLTTGMTLEAWVHPTALGNELPHGDHEGAAPGSMSYGLYANGSGTGRGADRRGLRQRLPRRDRAPRSLPVNTWTHLATTYNGNVLRST